MSQFRRGEVLYEGKAKILYRVEGEPDLLWQEFKDSLTAFNAQKKGSFPEKGGINRNISKILFAHLGAQGIGHHLVESFDFEGKAILITRKLAMIPLEVVVRNAVAGSLAVKFGRPEGEDLKQPLVEFYYKNDALNDPFVSVDQAIEFGLTSGRREWAELRAAALLVNEVLASTFKAQGFRLIDFKLEFGRDSQGQLMLGDEISPDTCRLWDIDTGEKFDKDRFRRELGGVEDAYREVENRLLRIGPSGSPQSRENGRGLEVSIQLSPRPEVLDPQGRAVEELLRREGEPIASVSIGRRVQLRFATSEVSDALKRSQAIARRLLANELIENFEIVDVQPLSHLKGARGV